MTSLLSSILALFIFGAGILTLQDIKNPEFNFTVANALFYISAVLQVLFCQSLIGQITFRSKAIFGLSLFIFFVIFEYMRHYSSFEGRTIFMASIAAVLYVWQMYILSLKKQQAPSKQLLYLQIASCAEMIFAMGRVVILTTTSFPILQVDQLPQLLILFTIAQLVMNTLSYIAIGGYWAERIALANAKTSHENEEIKSLLQEREALIGSLLKANKTASTGALSASIAHELNQPLGASSLNIQFLQKKLADGDVDSKLQKEVLDTLLADNQRAANIIRSLRSIFTEGELATSQVDIGELLDTVLSITRPEIQSKNIQMVLRAQPGLVLQANPSEIQQVLLNLVNNAIQALAVCTKLSKQLTISAKRCSDLIEISVADNADGIDAQSQVHLFELLASTKRTGMGLGLWLCKHIITRHGGSIRFEENDGGGAKFVLHLPIEP
jgi:signal transduction histidine kinase